MRLWQILPAIMFMLATSLSLLAETGPKFELESLPAVPDTGGQVLVAVGAGQVLATVDTRVFVLSPKRDTWIEAGTLSQAGAPGVLVGTEKGVYCISESTSDDLPIHEVTQLKWDTESGKLQENVLGPLPAGVSVIAATAIGDVVYVTDGRELSPLTFGDVITSAPPATLPVQLEKPAIVEQQGKLYLVGKTGEKSAALRYDPQAAGWQELSSPDAWPTQPGGVSFGLAHVLFFMQPGGTEVGEVTAYHTITDSWISFGKLEADLSPSPAVANLGGKVVVLGVDAAMLVRPAQLQTNYSWIDNVVVGAYLLGMVGIGWYFTKRENSSNDFFRGGQRIPWWAAGMSLFATGASAISLAGMPGMGFGTDWTYFVISICSAICLPIAIFVMAPLVRRLQISTANEYLERRFGVTSRLFASVIFMFSQVASRIASVMLLSAIALEAITDMDITTAIIIMGVVTTIYTYLGGLEAVIWTDTVQGFVMVTTVVGCLLLALFKLDMPLTEMWSQAQSYDKLHMFDFSNSLIGPTTYIFFVHTLFLTFGGISDQNFVQRVQSTPDLRQTKLAVTAQMAVAIPINVLLFSLGTALWLFYRSHPDSLSPTIVNNDGVFPFFAAQQLPIGISGVVVAALLAATMSTVSSSICAVSDLGTNDFYRRFKTNATDHQCLVLGRILTAVVGLLGTLAAITLASIEDVKSVWDLAIMVTGLISSSVIGLFMLGLMTRKSHEVGALIGAAAGMTTIVLMKMYCPITFWLYIVIGPIITIIVGVIASMVLPGQRRDTKGLTFYSLTHSGPAAERTTDM